MALVTATFDGAAIDERAVDAVVGGMLRTHASKADRKRREDREFRDAVVECRDLLRRLVALEEERREAERGFEELTEQMRKGTFGKPVDERAPNDPRGRR